MITGEIVFFFIFAVLLIASALGVLVARSPVYAAMNLVAAFFFMAGLYVLLTAHLIAFMQVLVYAGAVMVLFLFVIMLLSLGDEHLVPEPSKRAMQWVGVVGAVALALVIATAISRLGDVGVANVDGAFGTVKAVGRVL